MDLKVLLVCNPRQGVKEFVDCERKKTKEIFINRILPRMGTEYNKVVFLSYDDRDSVSPLINLLEHIKLLDEADVVFFTEDWNQDFTCRIINQCTFHNKKKQIGEWEQRVIKCAKGHICKSCGKTIGNKEPALREKAYAFGNWFTDYFCMNCSDEIMKQKEEFNEQNCNL